MEAKVKSNVLNIQVEQNTFYLNCALDTAWFYKYNSALSIEKEEWTDFLSFLLMVFIFLIDGCSNGIKN